MKSEITMAYFCQSDNFVSILFNKTKKKKYFSIFVVLFLKIKSNMNFIC